MSSYMYIWKLNNFSAEKLIKFDTEIGNSASRCVLNCFVKCMTNAHTDGRQVHPNMKWKFRNIWNKMKVTIIKYTCECFRKNVSKLIFNLDEMKIAPLWHTSLIYCRKRQGFVFLYEKLKRSTFDEAKGFLWSMFRPVRDYSI